MAGPENFRWPTSPCTISNGACTSARRKARTSPIPASCSTAAWRIAPRNSARRRSRPRIAAVSEDDERLIAEAADLLYHLLVVLQARGITLADVEATLAARTRNPASKKRRRASTAERAHGRSMEQRTEDGLSPYRSLHARGMGGACATTRR